MQAAVGSNHHVCSSYMHFLARRWLGGTYNSGVIVHDLHIQSDAVHMSICGVQKGKAKIIGHTILCIQPP